MSSAAQPVNQPDALRLLLDRILRGTDATLIADGDAARVLLDLVADCLSGRRIRTLRDAEVLPSRLTASSLLGHAAEQAKASLPDDAALSRSFQALTVLDQSCDRIVLLVGDAHAVQHSALRYVQFASRSAAHLQLVFCGTRALFDLLNIEEFAWLRARLMTDPILILAAPVPEDENTPPLSVPHTPAAWAGEATSPPPIARRPAVSASRDVWFLRFGVLALLGLGGAAGLMLGLRYSGADGPAASQQAASVVQSPTPPDTPTPGLPATGATSQADPGVASATLDSLPPHLPATAGDLQGVGGESPSSVPAAPPPAEAPSSLVTVWLQPRAGTPENEPRLPKPPMGLARSLGRTVVPAAPSRTVAAAPGSRARRSREVRDQAPPRDDQWVPSQSAFGSWTALGSQAPRYIGSYTTDANGVRMFHLEP